MLRGLSSTNKGLFVSSFTCTVGDWFNFGWFAECVELPSGSGDTIQDYHLEPSGTIPDLIYIFKGKFMPQFKKKQHRNVFVEIDCLNIGGKNHSHVFAYF